MSISLIKISSLELIISSLGSIAALAWNNAFLDLISKTPGLTKYGLWIYALLITIIYVMVINFVEESKKLNTK